MRERPQNLERRYPRRSFLQQLAGAGCGSVLARTGLLRPALAALLSPGALPAFEEIPPSASGIASIHSNGRSPEMYLPETVGAGCAFLDYDNDGWMDIYLVNSGGCDFFTPPNAAAQRALQ